MSSTKDLKSPFKLKSLLKALIEVWVFSENHHFEILSQLGIFGYTMFLTFFIYFIGRGVFIYNKNKNIFHLSALVFIFVYLFSPVPSGSFFTTFSASIFWINFALVLTFEGNKFNKT